MYVHMREEMRSTVGFYFISSTSFLNVKSEGEFIENFIIPVILMLTLYFIRGWMSTGMWSTWMYRKIVGMEYQIDLSFVPRFRLRLRRRLKLNLLMVVMTCSLKEYCIRRDVSAYVRYYMEVQMQIHFILLMANIIDLHISKCLFI